MLQVFLIINKLSYPFYNRTDHNLFSPESRLKKALNLLDDFIEHNISIKNNFQFILLDNEKPKTIKKFNLKHIHFVEHFPHEDKALIPKYQIDLMAKKTSDKK